MHDLTAFQRDLLWVIAGHDDNDGPPMGLRLKEAVGQYRGEDIHHGRLYPALDDLADRGLIEKAAVNDRANAYTLTDDGQAALRDRHEWEAKQLVDDSAEVHADV